MSNSEAMNEVKIFGTNYDRALDDSTDYRDHEIKDCMTCHGDGFVPGNELNDPLFYQPDKYYTCRNCGGTGNAKDQTYW